MNITQKFGSAMTTKWGKPMTKTKCWWVKVHIPLQFNLSFPVVKKLNGRDIRKLRKKVQKYRAIDGQLNREKHFHANPFGDKF